MSKIKEFFNRFLSSTTIGVLSLKFFIHHRKLLFFPFISASISTLAIIISFIIAPRYLNGFMRHPILILFTLLTFSFLLTLNNIFFNMTSTFLVDQYCQEGTASLKKSFFLTLKKIKKIIIWAFFTMFIRVLSSRKKNQVYFAATSFLKFILGTSWRYLSFFIYPIFAFEQKSLFASLKESVLLIKNNFGSLSGALLGFNILYLLFFLIAVLYCLLSVGLIMGIFWIIQITNMQHVIYGIDISFIVFAFFFFLMVCFVFFCTTIISTTELITATVLYRHINGFSIGIFDPNYIKPLFQQKESLKG